MKKVIMWAMVAGFILSGSGALHSAALGPVDDRDMDASWKSLWEAMGEGDLETVQVFVPAIIRKDQRRNKPTPENRNLHGLTPYEMANDLLKYTPEYAPSRKKMEQIVAYLKPDDEAKEQAEQDAPPSYKESIDPVGTKVERSVLMYLIPNPKELALGKQDAYHIFGRPYSEITQNKGNIDPELTKKLRHYIELAITKYVGQTFIDKVLHDEGQARITVHFALQYLAHSIIASGRFPEYVNIIADAYSMEPADPDLVAVLRRIATEKKPEAIENVKAMEVQLWKK